MSSDSEKSFVNRRGRKQGLDMTSEVADFELQTKTSPDKPKFSLKMPRVRKKLSRRWRVVVVAALIILVITPIVLGEMVRLSYVQSLASAKSSLSELVRSKVTTAQSKDDLSSGDIGEIARELQSIRDSSCSGGLVDNIASVYPRAKSAHDECIALRGVIAGLAAPMQDMYEQLEYLEKLQPITDIVSRDQGDQFAVLSAQQENWKSVADKLKQLSPPTSFRENHESLHKQADQIAELWMKLSKAHDVQDAEAFRATEVDLAKSYEAFRTFSDKFKLDIGKSQSQVSSAYAKVNL